MFDNRTSGVDGGYAGPVPRMLLLASLLLAACGRPAPPPPEPPTAPDVALIVIDTLRADAPTPALDAWAEGGRRYTQAVASASWTLPSVIAILAGREVRANHQRAPAGWRLLPEQFQAAGYRTHAVIANATLAPGTGLHRGFDAVELSGPRAWDAAEVLRRADAFLAGPRDRPRFLYLQFMEPHLPYAGDEAPGRPGWSVDPGPPPDGVADLQWGCVERWRRRYDAEVLAVDAALTGWLAASTLDVIAVTADHGEGLFEHPLDPRWAGRGMPPSAVEGCDVARLPGYPDHGLQRWDEAVRVPLLLRAPGVAEGSVEARQVRVVDVGRTLLRLAGAAQGGPTLPLDAAEPEAAVAAGVDKGGSFLRSGGWKLIREADGRESLHRVSDGPPHRFPQEAEEVDDPARRDVLSAVLTAWAAEAVPLEGPDPDTAAALKALGYLE